MATTAMATVATATAARVRTEAVATAVRPTEGKGRAERGSSILMLWTAAMVRYQKSTIICGTKIRKAKKQMSDNELCLQF